MISGIAYDDSHQHCPDIAVLTKPDIYRANKNLVNLLNRRETRADHRRTAWNLTERIWQNRLRGDYDLQELLEARMIRQGLNDLWVNRIHMNAAQNNWALEPWRCKRCTSSGQCRLCVTMPARTLVAAPQQRKRVWVEMELIGPIHGEAMQEAQELWEKSYPQIKKQFTQKTPCREMSSPPL